jgi:hypothetical protein
VISQAPLISSQIDFALARDHNYVLQNFNLDISNKKRGKANLTFLSMARKALATFLLIVPLAASIKFSDLMQSSDYLTAFYVAGRMVLAGNADKLYPAVGASSLLVTPFNTFAHSVLAHMPAQIVAVYMYSPLIACIFVPFAMLPPEYSMFAWQLTSLAILAVSSALIGSLFKKDAVELFFISCLCCAVFQTLLIGAIGIGIGLLPLAGGYYLLMRKQYFYAGLAFALLLLKLQFLPAALLLAGALTLLKRPACALGLGAGVALLSLITALCLSPAVFMHWIASLKLSDTIFSDPSYGYPVYLVSSLPAMIMHLFPMEMRNVVKLPCYLMSAFIGLHALWFARALLKANIMELQRVIPHVMLIAIFVLPLVLPHFLFYDLCVLSLASMIVFGTDWQDDLLQKQLQNVIGFVFAFVGVYMVLYMSPLHAWAQSIVLVSGLCAAYVRVLLLFKPLAKPTATPRE